MIRAPAAALVLRLLQEEREPEERASRLLPAAIAAGIASHDAEELARLIRRFPRTMS